MKAINLKERSEKTINALQEAIKEAEGRATARKISYHDIFTRIEAVEGKLKITKKAMNGIKICCDPNAQDFPKAYKYTPESTHFVAEYKNGSWRITNIFRDVCGKHDIKIELTEEAEKAILENYRVMW